MGLLSWLRTSDAATVDRVKRAENTVQQLTRRLDALELEWESVLDKIARYTARQAARARRGVERDLGTAGEEPPTGAPAPDSSPVVPLSPRPSKAELRRALASGTLRKLGG